MAIILSNCGVAIRLLTTLVALGVTWGGFPARAASPPAVIPLSEIQAGMRGYGLSVFRGSRIDTFQVEVVGVQEKNKVDGSYILIEVSGQNLELSRVAQGMSGSPVYLDGRFAGAVAFGWPGSLEALAGVTPAHEMLRMPREAELAAAWTGAPDVFPVYQELIQTNSSLAAELDLGPQPERAAPTLAPRWPTADHLVQQLLETRLKAAGHGTPAPAQWFSLPLAGEAAGNPSISRPPKRPLRPGSACGIPLVTGDAILGVTGTVSYVDGQDVFMMGHPFMQRGPVDMPLAVADVMTIMPSREMSFKVSGIGEIVGTVHHDLRAGLVGKLGPAPTMIPVEVAIAEGDQGAQIYRFEIVQDPLLTSPMVFWTLYNSLMAQGNDASNQNIRYELETRWKRGSTAEEETLIWSGSAGGPGGAVSLAPGWLAPFDMLIGNPFEPMRLKSIRARMEISRPLAGTRIIGLDVQKKDTELLVAVEMKPRLGEPRVEQVRLPLPSTLAPGPYRVVAASEAEFFALEATRAPGRFQVSSLSATLNLLREPRALDQLMVVLLGPGSHQVVGDREFAGLPASTGRVLGGGNIQIKKTMADYHSRATVAQPFALQGHVVREIVIGKQRIPLPEERRP